LTSTITETRRRLLAWRNGDRNPLEFGHDGLGLRTLAHHRIAQRHLDLPRTAHRSEYDAASAMGRDAEQPYSPPSRLFQFEGASRRVENPIDPSSSVDAKSQQKKDMHSPAPAPLPSIDADLQRLEGSAPTEWSESTVGLKQ
jgi:hypothetical protein